MPLSAEMMAFAEANPVAFMATVDGNKPRVRAFNMWKVDENGFYFHNNKKEDLFEQLRRNQNIELLFAPAGGAGAALRAEGRVEFISDAATAEKFYQTPEKGKFRGRRKDSIDSVIFRVSNGKAWFRPAPDAHPPKDVPLPSLREF